METVKKRDARTGVPFLSAAVLVLVVAAVLIAVLILILVLVLVVAAVLVVVLILVLVIGTVLVVVLVVVIHNHFLRFFPAVVPLSQYAPSFRIYPWL